MLTGWKTLDTQNNSLTVDPSEEEGLDNRYTDNGGDTILSLKQVICVLKDNSHTKAMFWMLNYFYLSR
jgi:hypothetical protein